MEVTKVITDKDLIVKFADGTEYAVFEGVVPGKWERSGLSLTSDICFVMDVTTEDWKLVDWVCGITLMSIDNIVELCKELKG